MHPAHFKDYSLRSKYRLYGKRQRLDNTINENNQSSSNSSEESGQDENDHALIQSVQVDHIPNHHEVINENISEDEWYSSNEEEEGEVNRDDNDDNDDLAVNLEVDNPEPIMEHENDVSDNDSDTDGYDDDNNDVEEDPLLYAGAPITEGESLMSIMTFATRFSLTGVALSALLKLISMHCPTPNLCKKSLYLFKKHFSSTTIPLRRRFYCDLCHRNLDTIDSTCQDCIDNDPLTEAKTAYFIEIPLLAQLKTLYRRPGFVELLQQRLNKVKHVDENYEDINDGQIYKDFSRPPNFLSNENNISFTWNADGVSLFKSSKFEIWPFYLSINEIPYVHRTRKENLLLAGLWFGRKKPQPATFLDTICDDLDEIKNGVDIEAPDNNNIIHMQGRVICGTCDLPAKALFLNMKQFNGEYRCQKCKIHSELLEPGSRGRVYPYHQNLNLRTQEETNNFAREAVLSGDDVYGVKGPTPISRMTESYIEATAIDSMHCVFLGVVRALLLIWFSSGDGIFFRHAGVVEKLIQLISPPDFVPRLPRTIIENLAYLKASELKAWFFYYSLPILKTFMTDAYFEHYMLLVYSTYMLHQASVSENMVDAAEKFLNEFVEQFPDLYGRKNMTANLHQLLHLPQNVRDFGPPWTTSCFPYENANGLLKTLVTGTKFAQLQICTGISLFMNIPELKKKLVADRPPAKFCERLSNQQKTYKMHKISENLSIIGIFGKTNELPAVVSQTLRSSGINGINVKVFYRLSNRGILYTSELYRRCTRTNSTYIKYTDDHGENFGVTHCFVKISDCDCNDFCEVDCNARYFAIVRKCQTFHPFSIHQDIVLPFIYRCNKTNTFCAVEVSDLSLVCFYIKTQSQNINYIVEPVNMLELE